MKTHLHKRKFNECSVGLFIYRVYDFRKNELAFVFPCYILLLLIIAASALPLTASLPLPRTSTALLSFSSFFGKATLPFLSRLCLTLADQSVNQFTPKTLISSNEKQLNSLAELANPNLNQSHNGGRSKLRKSKGSQNVENDKSDHKIIIAKQSVFPCLDSLEVSLFNLSEPLSDYHHLIRVYHSNALNKQTNTSSSPPIGQSFEKSAPLRTDPFVNSAIWQDEDQLSYVKEFIVNDPPLINAKYTIHCGLFDPVYLLYCFRYVSINQTNGQIRFESEELYCLPTLLATLWPANGYRNADHRRQRKKSQKNAELAKSNSDNYSGGYGSSLRLYGGTVEKEELASGRREFVSNAANQHTQTKHVVCSCGKRSSLEAHKTNYRIRLTSGNGYCSGSGRSAQRPSGEEEATSKSLIKIRKLNFEFCFIDLTLPTWIEIKVKDVLLIDQKDPKQPGSSSLIIRDGQTYISPQLNYLHSFPTFHYISSGLLRFESSSLGNQYTIELNQLTDKIDLSAVESSALAGDSNKEDTYERLEETKSEASKRNRFMNERQTKLNHTERTLRPDQESFKGKLDQALHLKHLSSPGKPRTNKRTDSKDESRFVLLIDQDDQNLLIDDQIGLNERINRILSETHQLNLSSYERLLQDELDTVVERQERTRRLMLNFIWFLLFSLISVSISVFVWIFTKTQTRLPTAGNLIRFGLPDDHFLANTYQEVASRNGSSKSSTRSKLVKIDEERIYESCRTRNSTSDQEESDSPNDLLNDTEDGSETENELNNLSNNSLKSVPGGGNGEFSNSETLKNETTLYRSSFKDDFHELNKKRKMFKNCFNGCGSKEDLSNEAAVGSRLSQCSFPTSEISLELDYYDYLTPLSAKAPFGVDNGNNL